jgi:Protein of unknown function (DUF3306)
VSEATKPTDTGGEGESFLSRWSRRKVEVKVSPPATEVDTQLSNPSTGEPSGAKVPETPLPERTLASEAEEKPPLPTIDSLTAESDFSPFITKDVDPALRNQAMKKLFTDPHYQFDNMDKLDIYIDDYSKSDPIPLDILRKMYQSKALFLFEDEEKEEEAARIAAEAKLPRVPVEETPAELAAPVDATASVEALPAVVDNPLEPVVEKQPADASDKA